MNLKCLLDMIITAGPAKCIIYNLLFIPGNPGCSASEMLLAGVYGQTRQFYTGFIKVQKIFIRLKTQQYRLKKHPGCCLARIQALTKKSNHTA